MIVLDISVNFITLMVTNYNWEGLIDENIGINLIILTFIMAINENYIQYEIRISNDEDLDKNKFNKLYYYRLSYLQI